jgi:hypothetical protein
MITSIVNTSKATFRRKSIPLQPEAKIYLRQAPRVGFHGFLYLGQTLAAALRIGSFKVGFRPRCPYPFQHTEVPVRSPPDEWSAASSPDQDGADSRVGNHRHSIGLRCGSLAPPHHPGLRSARAPPVPSHLFHFRRSSRPMVRRKIGSLVKDRPANALSQHVPPPRRGVASCGSSLTRWMNV